MAGTKGHSSGQKPKGSSWRRTADYAYAFFFILHIVIMFMVDLVPLYPEALKPAFLDDIRSFYINTYQDKFFIDPPAWFGSYIVMELVYHVPASIINASKLLNGKYSILIFRQ
ncbi:integral membrane protein, putative [Trichophyton benhamiae CBS 112371]|uniref:Integral membrane protein, putative n=1 Tax=Arthroderma benhamiae (strain ATCC MYA-4681 / CBS 112371) TaxID=663331 RepID=D4AY59_ARTBC|nr:integral membrane protein, putative [Trichophyton benhamiae CBS 112371]EFE31875.1 integral membrane protein, putative [Trichophyton benhamiae CBS 112371]